jgi:hypothetical protein
VRDQLLPPVAAKLGEFIESLLSAPDQAVRFIDSLQRAAISLIPFSHPILGAVADFFLQALQSEHRRALQIPAVDFFRSLLWFRDFRPSQETAGAMQQTLLGLFAEAAPGSYLRACCFVWFAGWVPRYAQFVAQFWQDFLNEWQEVSSSRAYLQNVLFCLAAGMPTGEGFLVTDEMLLDWIHNLQLLDPELWSTGMTGFLSFVRSPHFRQRLPNPEDQVVKSVFESLTRCIVALVVPCVLPDGRRCDGICHMRLTQHILVVCSELWAVSEGFREFVQVVWQEEPNRLDWFCVSIRQSLT